MEQRGEARPNVLFFFTDDQRYATIGALGQDPVVTPTMDALIERGTAFENAYIMGGSCPAVCMPSRAMLMTGRGLFRIEGEGQGISEGQVLLGECLREAGYVTFGTGKWHNGPRAYARSFDAGAEIFFGGMDDHWNVPACDFDPTGRYDNRQPVVPDPGRSNRVNYRHCDHIRPGKHSSELFCDAAIDFIEGYEGDQPFFMYLSFMAPHDPRTMPARFREMYDPDEIVLPPNFCPEHPFDNGEMAVRDELLAAFPRDEREIRRHIAEYYAMISHADAQMGRVLNALEAAGQMENTIVILAGDNGLALGQHGLMGKQNLYEHSVRVPLVMAGPGIAEGEPRSALCYLSDIYPTICDLVGLPVPGTVQGQSLVPALGLGDEGGRESLLFAYKNVQRAIRDGRYKLIEYVVDGERSSQLFDLQEDPWETRNLIDEPGLCDTVSRLRQGLKRWPQEWGDTRPGLGQTFWRAWRD